MFWFWAKLHQIVAYIFWPNKKGEESIIYIRYCRRLWWPWPHINICTFRYTNKFHLLFVVFWYFVYMERIHFCNKTSSDGHLWWITMRITHFGCWSVNFKNDEISDDSLTPSRSHKHTLSLVLFLLFPNILYCICARKLDSYIFSSITYVIFACVLCKMVKENTNEWEREKPLRLRSFAWNSVW